MSGGGLRIVALATHPIQYHSPWFRALVAEGVDLHVLFACLPDPARQAVGFGGAFRWDVPLLQGFSWSVLPSAGTAPDLDRFLGVCSRGLGRALSALAPDVVLLTGWNACSLVQGLGAGVLLGIPTVVRGESSGMEPRPWWKAAGHRALLAAYSSFVAIGKGNQAFYEANGVRPERIVEGGYFVDEEHLLELRRRESPGRADHREAWGIPPEACCVLFAGKLQSKKRPLDFVQALGSAARSLPQGALHGLVVGSGEMENEMREAAAACNAPVVFAGFLNQSEIGRAYVAADALVLPSDWGETWGLVVNEAMLFGLPVVVSDRVGCGPDLVCDGETGFIVPAGDVPALSGRLVNLAQNDEMRREMGMHAHERVRGYSARRGALATMAAARIALQGV